MSGTNLLGDPDPILLPEDAEAAAERAAGLDPAEVAGHHPTYSAAWADLADRADASGSHVEAYAYARVGYHRGLDALRRNGWKGWGAVPWSHPANRGFLRCVHALARAATAIGESDEVTRCRALLDDCDPSAAAALDVTPR